jgi:hypothetical protein
MASEPEPTGETADRTPPPPGRARMARLIFLGAAVGAAAILLPMVPREHAVELRLDDPATVTGVEVTWTKAGEGEALVGSEWHFAAGKAPRSIETSVKLPGGRYAVDAVVQRTEGSTEVHRSVDLADADQVTLPLR